MIQTLPAGPCPVNSHNEWDPLEEVIIGSLEGARFPGWNTVNQACAPPGVWDEIVQRAGGAGVPYPPLIVERARKCLLQFIHILEAEGVIVRHLDSADFSAAFGTPDWQVSGGSAASDPRDPFLIIGNEIIETPMADRGRYFEAWPYRTLFKEYFRKGARWTSAPKPQLVDALYEPGYQVPGADEPMRYILTEFEPVFDAADFVRCGRDIFGQTSQVTNRFGIEWLRRHLGPQYRVHELENRSPYTLHIDTTFMPLAPGKVLVSPDFLDLKKLPPILRNWELLIPPEPVPVVNDPLQIVSKWMGLNVLMLDEKRVVVEERQESLIKAFKDWGFTPIPCPFEAYYSFFGSFHCATLDVRRRGTLQSYF